MSRPPRVLFLLAMLCLSAFQAAPALEAQKVTDQVYALVGDLGNRTPENLGNNATFGFVVTGDGVVVVDSGGTFLGAKQIHQAIQKVTDQPVKFVINTGGQDHRWLGNGYFQQLGATILASEDAVADQKARVSLQLTMLGNLVGDAGLVDTNEVYADQTFAEQKTFTLGGVAFEIHHVGPAHTPGDSFVWLPQPQVVFAGDIVYVERILGVSEFSNSKSWVQTFEAIAARKPNYVIPGHGHPTTLARATQDTYDYLTFLRQTVAEFMENGGHITDIGQVDQSKFKYLQNFDTLAGRNAQKVFSELEWE